MRALAVLAACLGLSVIPAAAFVHAGAHGGPAGGAQRHARAQDRLLGNILSGGYAGGYAGPWPVAQPELVPVPVPVPVPVFERPQLMAPAGSGPRIIYIGHTPPRTGGPKVIYGVR